jgi:hypothetical protein
MGRELPPLPQVPVGQVLDLYRGAAGRDLGRLAALLQVRC